MLHDDDADMQYESGFFGRIISKLLGVIMNLFPKSCQTSLLIHLTKACVLAIGAIELDEDLFTNGVVGLSILFVNGDQVYERCDANNQYVLIYVS